MGKDFLLHVVYNWSLSSRRSSSYRYANLHRWRKVSLGPFAKLVVRVRRP